MKKLIIIPPLFLLIVSLQAQEIEIRENKAYYVELCQATVIVDKNPDLDIKNIELDIISGKIDLWESHRIDSVSYSLGEEESFRESIKQQFDFVVLDRERVEIQGVIHYNDGTEKRTKVGIIDILPHPEIDEENFIIFRPLKTTSTMGSGGAVLAEIFTPFLITDKEKIISELSDQAFAPVSFLEERIVYLHGSYHRVYTLPLWLHSEESGLFSLLPENVSLEVYDTEKNQPLQISFPVFERKIEIYPPKTTGLFTANNLAIMSKALPEKVLKDDSFTYSFTLVSDGNLNVLKIDQPGNWGKFDLSKGDLSYHWNDTGWKLSRTYILSGNIPTKFGIRLAPLHISYMTPDGSIQNTTLEMGYIPGNINPRAFIMFFVILLLTFIFLILFFKLSLKRLKKRGKNNVLTMNEDTKKLKMLELAEEYELTGREQDILCPLIQGKTNKEIGDILCISIETVKKHIQNIMKKTGTHSRMEVYVFVENFIKKH